MTRKVSLEELLKNEPQEITIPTLDISVKVKLPTNKDKTSSWTVAEKIDGYEKFSELEKNALYTRILASKMLVDPAIEYSNLGEFNDSEVDLLLDSVAFWYASKLKALGDKRRAIMNHFLPPEKENKA